MSIRDRRGLLSIGALGLLLLATGSGTAQDDGDPNERRYESRDPLSLTLPRRPITRRDYVDFLRPLARDFDASPAGCPWGWVHGPLQLRW